MSIITNLWYGDIDPQESGIFNTPKVKEMTREAIKIREHLESKLTEEQKELLDQYIEFITVQEGVQFAIVFESGFKFGAQIVAEALLSDYSTVKQSVIDRCLKGGSDDEQ